VLSSVTNFIPFASASRELLRQHRVRLHVQKQVHQLEQARRKEASELNAALLQLDDILELYDFGDCDRLTELRQVVADLKTGKMHVRDKFRLAAAADFPTRIIMLISAVYKVL
jgi:hypothetical protein